MKRVQTFLLFFLICISFTFTSCDNFFLGPENLSNVTSKTTIKDFSEVNHPIVVSMEVMGSYHLFGNRSFAEKTKREGNIFVVIDWENNRVFDWVFQSDKSGCVNWRCIEQGTNPIRYCTASSGSQTVYFLEPGKNSVTTINTGVARYFDNYSSSGDRGLLFGSGYENGWNLYKLGVVDIAEQKMYDDVVLKTHDICGVCHPRADSDGNFWVTYTQDETTIVSKINTLTLKEEPLNLTFNCERTDSAPNGYSYDIAAIDSANRVVFIDRNPNGNGQLNESRIYAVSMDNPQNKKEFSCPNELNLKNNAYIYESVCYNGKLYTTISEAVPSCKFYSCEFNPATETAVVVSEPIDYDFTENIYLRGSRIYFMRSRNINNISYMYYDIATGKTSGITKIAYEDVISQN